MTDVERRGQQEERASRIALVAGASGGIGGAIALELGSRYERLWLVGRRADALDEVARRVDETTSVTTCPTDLTADGELERLGERVVREAARLDLLVLSAGTIAVGRLEEASTEDFDRQYAANLRAPHRLTQALLPLLRRSQGQVVFINSTAGLGPRRGFGQFAATQAAFKTMADTLRDEVNEHGVRVTSVFPGRTATSRQRHLHELERKEYRPDLLMQPADVARMVVTAAELPRTAEVTEIVMRPFVKG